MKSGNQRSGDIAQFSTIIDRILTANKEAEKFAEQAEQEKKTAIEHIGEQKAELKRKYSERAEKRIDIVRVQEKEFADEKINANRNIFEERIVQLDKVAEENKDKWAQNLFEEIIKG